MPVRELVLSLAGAIIALSTELIIVMCLAETRWHLGRSQWVVWWLPYRWSFTPKFSPVWYPLILHGGVDTVLGFLLAGKLTTKRTIVCALAGASLAICLGATIHGNWPRLYGRAGLNTMCIVGLFYPLAGGLAGVWVAEKLARGRDEPPWLHLHRR